MINALSANKHRKRISWMMLSILSLELICPTLARALSSGPVQPEISSFEPVGTTDMVDLFTGDFVYNIPLLDVEGYPINIAYHGGATMEQEASWVGLGWNISPGAINRAVRGLPDEFNGDTVEKEINIKPEVTTRMGLAVAAELFGVGEPRIGLSGTLGGYLIQSNYRGLSVDFTASAGINMNFFMVSAGMNIGASIGSQTGAAIDYGSSIGLGISQAVSRDLNAGASFNLNSGGVYSPRTGMRQNVGFNAGLSLGQNGSSNRLSMSTGTTIPIGLQNYTAAVTNACYMNTHAGALKVGGEIWGGYGSGKGSGSVATTKFDADGSRKGYGYLNLDNADYMAGTDLLDFSREKDGMFNTTMQLLPQAQLTYDVYNVSGQGTGGSFRPFRNDIGSIYDPVVTTTGNDNSETAEAGIGNLFEIGGEGISTYTDIKSGPWDAYKRKFGNKSGGYYENIYFKEAGELTDNNETYLNAYANADALTPQAVADIAVTKPGSGTRVIRANHIYTVSGKDEDSALLLSSRQLISISDTTGFATYPAVHRDTIVRVDRNGGQRLRRKADHVAEIVQTQKDGRRYVYGLPVMNNVQREATFAVDPKGPTNPVDATKQLVGYQAGVDDSKGNSRGRDHFYSGTVTPSYVSAHLLTGVLSADYADLTGDGISDDDLGTYTKFNYTRKSADYRWRAPIESGKAQYMPGYLSDAQDDKGYYMIGSREQWMLHSVETKNYVAEFFVSPRKDAKGVTDRILNGGLPYAYDQAPYNTTGAAKDQLSFKLDSIVLYNKHDRFINGAAAKPIKAVMFTYDYSLCKNAPNSETGYGKLTLQKVQLRYGSSNLNMSAAYGFTYSDTNPDYDGGAKDRWGMYKPNNAGLTNFEFPFTEQSDNTNTYATAWSLTQVSLPSGGVIKVDYEADDYAYVQDQCAMEMFKLAGIGNSTTYSPMNLLYFNKSTPYNMFYFTRRKDAENPALSARDNYLRGTNILYYNIPVEISSQFPPEQVKGYADVASGAGEVGYCSDGIHGYVRVSLRKLTGTSVMANPATFTALNLGRYNLPQIIFPGSNPDNSDIKNVIEGLIDGVRSLFNSAKNPLADFINEGVGKETNLNKAYMRLTSPGQKKRGGGQRVKMIRFYDNWAAMAGGNDAIYGKTYQYTIDDGKGEISSGVASYEPMLGGDEIPHRVPVGYVVQEGNSFPPNDPVELYQELPVGESFFPGPVVGYRKVVTHSINVDKGRSSQTEDINGYYTAKDFPIRVQASPISTPEAKKDITKTDITIEQQSTQGFSIFLNDMHGKPRYTEHWMLKPAGMPGARELLTSQYYEYQMKDGRLSSAVPVLDYNSRDGQLKPTTHTMGIETEVTLDSRERVEKTTTGQKSGNLNAFIVPFLGLIPIPYGYGFDYTNKTTFRCATATKVTQQYGILSKVTSNNEGAVTEMRNEVFDIQTGNALITSVNNEFKDRVYNVSYPAYWAYKEMGPAYENFNLTGTFTYALKIDTLGPEYGARFTNYNSSFSSHYDLPMNMPVAKIQIDEEMPKFKIGDEMLLYTTQFGAQPVRTWTMGYTSDINHCYLLLATREPYKMGGFWTKGASYDHISYRVVRSGNRNRLGETIQTYSTTDSSNIFPQLRNKLSNVINLNAQTYDHNLTQRFAPNMNSDSLNPFVTGKVGIYRPETQVQNMRRRNYIGGTTRNAGVFPSMAYWQTEQDNFAYYCPDSVVGSICGSCNLLFDSVRFTYMGGDSMKITFNPSFYTCNDQAEYLRVQTDEGMDSILVRPSGSYGMGLSARQSVVVHASFTYYPVFMKYVTPCCCAAFDVYFNGTNTVISRRDYGYASGLLPQSFDNLYRDSGLVYRGTPSGSVPSPYRIRKKILLGKVGHYSGTDLENWVKTQEVTKYNWIGQELENKEEGLGYNSAVYGYNQQLPVCVAKNARHSEVLFDGFEDYALLQQQPSLNASYLKLQYSPFARYLTATTALGGSSPYTVGTLSATIGTYSMTKDDAHTGYYSMKVPTGITAYIPVNAADASYAAGYTFAMSGPRKYVAALWLKPLSAGSGITTGYGATPSLSLNGGGSTLSFTLVPKTNIIEGWQLYEATFDMPAGYDNATLQLGGGFYYDDLRIYPFAANSKGFVYEPVTRKLMATLDENNYATIYEYDAEGNLVRTKRETEKGVLTITESRSTHHKAN